VPAEKLGPVEKPVPAEQPPRSIQVEPGGPSPEEYRAKQSAEGTDTGAKGPKAEDTTAPPVQASTSPQDEAPTATPDAPLNLMGLKKAELLARCKAAGIATTTRMTKKQLVEKLEALS